MMSKPERTFQGITLTTDRPGYDNNQQSEGAGREKKYSPKEKAEHTQTQGQRL